MGAIDACGFNNENVASFLREQIRDSNVKEVMERVVSEESNVRLARAKVELGEADAAIVYRSDAVSSGQVRSVSIPAELNIDADYLIGMLVGTQASDLAEAWINYVRSASSQRVFDQYGFVSR